MSVWGGVKYYKLFANIYCIISLTSVNLYIPEHKRIITDSQCFSTNRRYIPDNDLLRFNIRKFFLVGIVRHLWVKICKNGRPLVIFWMLGVVDTQIFNGDFFGHVAGVAEIMLTRIGTTYQAGTY